MLVKKAFSYPSMQKHVEQSIHCCLRYSHHFCVEATISRIFRGRNSQQHKEDYFQSYCWCSHWLRVLAVFPKPPNCLQKVKKFDVNIKKKNQNLLHVKNHLLPQHNEVVYCHHRLCHLLRIFFQSKVPQCNLSLEIWDRVFKFRIFFEKVYLVVRVKPFVYRSEMPNVSEPVHMYPWHWPVSHYFEQVDWLQFYLLSK